MSAPQSIWLDVVVWLKAMDARLPATFPTELPAESSPGFWFRAAQLEMTTRDRLSAKLQLLVAGSVPAAMTPLEAWLARRRFEWAAQLTLVKVQQGIEPADPLPVVLSWLLVDSWASDGCLALWNHAERGGQPHPNNPDGLSPL